MTKEYSIHGNTIPLSLIVDGLSNSNYMWIAEVLGHDFPDNFRIDKHKGKYKLKFRSLTPHDFLAQAYFEFCIVHETGSEVILDCKAQIHPFVFVVVPFALLCALIMAFAGSSVDYFGVGLATWMLIYIPYQIVKLKKRIETKADELFLRLLILDRSKLRVEE